MSANAILNLLYELGKIIKLRGWVSLINSLIKENGC